MGKATIIGGGADGLYTIKIDAGAQQQASRVEAINQELATVAERIAQAETEYLATTTAETNAMAILNVAIESYASAVQADPETASTADVDRLTGTYYEASAYAAQARVRLQALMLQQRQLESDKSNLAAAPAEETREAWCVDLTEDASGDVATIEVPGEPGTVLVAPGGRAPSAGDGALLARELMTPEQAFFNAAILPGWQKWMPTFRTGTITAINIDNDTADVSLDAATSSAQGLGINQASSLSGVPVEYMECNAAAFEVGDPCVVRFDGQSWDAPKVVGFAREPKTCIPAEYLYINILDKAFIGIQFIEKVYAGNYYSHPECGQYIAGGLSDVYQITYSDYLLILPTLNGNTVFSLGGGGSFTRYNYGRSWFNRNPPSDGQRFLYSGGFLESVSGGMLHISASIYSNNYGYIGSFAYVAAEFLGTAPSGWYLDGPLGGPYYCVAKPSITAWKSIENDDYSNVVRDDSSIFNSFQEFEGLMYAKVPTPPSFTQLIKGKPVEYVFDGWGNKGRYIKTPSTPKASMQARYKPAKYAK